MIVSTWGWTCRLLAVAGLLMGAAARHADAAVLADSIANWDATGTQGTNGWLYGWYNKTDDANALYEVSDLNLFQNLGTAPAVRPNGNHWQGTFWDLQDATVDGGDPNGGVASVPWTNLGQEDTHPNGINQLAPNNKEHWTVRRWVSNVDGPTCVAITWHLRKTGIGGTGVDGGVYINGQLADSRTLWGREGAAVGAVFPAANNGDATNTGTTRTVYAVIRPGDVVDLYHSPVGLNGTWNGGVAGFDTGDGSDGSRNYMRIETATVVPGTMNPSGVVADSWADFSGIQGTGNWLYGFYDRSYDLANVPDPARIVPNGNGTYDALNDFELFPGGSDQGAWSDTNHFNNGIWDFNPAGASVGNPSWLAVGRLDTFHPQDSNPAPEHHGVRRWISEVDGPVRIEGFWRNDSASGDGTIGQIYINGVLESSIVTDGYTRTFVLNKTLAMGDLVDFVLTPNSPVDDGSDNTHFRVTIETMAQVVPEPSTFGLAGMSLVGLLGWARRRRTA